MKEAESFEDILLELSNDKGLVERQQPAKGNVPRSELTVDGVRSRLLLQIETAEGGLGEKELLRAACLTSPEAQRVGKLALKELADAGRVGRRKMNVGYRYNAVKSREQMKAAVLLMIEGGVHGERDILKKAGADKDALAELVAGGKIRKAASQWIINKASTDDDVG